MKPASEDSESLQSEVAELKQTVENLQHQLEKARKGRREKPSVRRVSKTVWFGLPLYAIAMGPDPSRGELKGHAKGIVAIGDLATGIIAIGGFARGIVAIGGMALGIFAVGGVAVGAVASLGGVAAGYFCLGGVAYGVHPVGGVAFKVGA